MNVHVHRSGNLCHLLTELLCDLVVVLLVATDHLDIDRRREPSIKNLANNIRGLHEKRIIRVFRYQLLPDFLYIIPGRTMLLLVERDQDLSVGRTDRGSVTQSKIEVQRQTNVSKHKINLVLRDYTSNDILDLRKNMLSLLDPSADRRPHMQPKLTRVNQREEILTQEWHQDNQ